MSRPALTTEDRDQNRVRETPVWQRGRKVFSMAPDLILRSYWVLPPLEYADDDELRRLVKSKIVGPAERARSEYAERIAAVYKLPT